MTTTPPEKTKRPAAEQKRNPVALPKAPPPKEVGGPAGAEPTRFGDWERNGRCSDF